MHLLKMAVVSEVSGDLTDCTLLYSLQNLYLKPIARMVIVVTLPSLQLPGVTVSNWEVMERLKAMVAPDQFSSLKVAKSTPELLSFDAEVESKGLVSKFIMKLDAKGIKLSGFADVLKVRAARKKVPFPKKHEWTAYFRSTANMDENNPGERPDTVHIKNMPTKWFVENQRDARPSEAIVIAIFSQFGDIRQIDIPINDPYRQRILMFGETDKPEEDAPESGFRTFSHGSNVHFDCYIQYGEYPGFVKCMRALRGKKLLCIMEDGKAACANIDIDFDKTSQLSDKNVKKRDKRREKLIIMDAEEEERKKKEQEEMERQKEIEELEHRRKELLELREVQDALKQKEERRLQREEKRKKKREEKKLLAKQQQERAKRIADMTASMEIQRKQEAVALVTVLLAQIAKRKQEEEILEQRRQAEVELRKQIEEKKRKLEDEKKREEKLKRQRLEELDSQEAELKKRLKQIMLEKSERQKEAKRHHKVKKMKHSRASVKSFQKSSRY